MEFFADNILLIFLLPLITSCLCLFTYVFNIVSFGMINRFSFLSGITGLIFSAGLFKYILVQNIQEVQCSLNWISVNNFIIEGGIYADKLSVLFLTVFMIVGIAVLFYSFRDIPRNRKYPLFLLYINLMNVFGTGFFLSSNLIQTLIFGELISITGYLMINLNCNKNEISNSAKRVFIMNKIGDTLFLTGIIILIYFSLTYPVCEGKSLLTYSDLGKSVSDLYVYLSDSWFYITCLLILSGVTVKAAQMPFHTWLTEADEGSVSAITLINTVTVTACGIFTVLRLLPLFELSDSVMNTILYIGLTTALLCGLFALSQNNIKKMLSYSTSSQAGIMFAAVGLNIPLAAVLYFLAHAFSKSVLFLSAGNFYKLKGKTGYDMSDFMLSGKQYPLSAFAYFISVVALSGLFFAGATAKDMITDFLSSSVRVLGFFVFVIVLFVNSLYLFKSYFMIFENKNKSEEKLPLHYCFVIPVVLTVIMTVLTAFFPLNILEFGNKFTDISSELLSDGSKYITTLTAILSGAVIGCYTGITGKKFVPECIKNLFAEGFYLSRIYNALADNISYFLGNFAKNFDKYVINGIFNIFVNITKLSGWINAVFQNGNLQSYFMCGIMFISLIIGIIGLFLFILRGVNL